MAIKVKVIGEQGVKREYPYLGRYEDGVVLFTQKKTGIWLVGESDRVGNYIDYWAEESFTPLSPSESITLSNKA